MISSVRSWTVVVLPNELIQATVVEQAVPLLVDVGAMRAARSLAIKQHAEGNRFPRTRRQHKMCVARAEAVGDAPSRTVEHHIFPRDGPVSGERPVVQAQERGQLVPAWCVQRYGFW